MIRDSRRWSSISALATLMGLAFIWQGCNVFAGLDSVQFEGGGAAGGGGSGNGGNATGPSTGAAGGNTAGNGGSTSMGGQGGMNTGGSMQTTSSVGGAMTTSSSSGGGMMTTSSSSSGSMSSSSSSGTGSGTMGTIGCGDAKTCALGSEVCCWDKHGTKFTPESGQCMDAKTAMDTCDDSTTATGMQSIIECQTSDQCQNGLTCCGFVKTNPMAFYASISCEVDCPGGGPTIIMCTGPGDPICPAPQTCGQSMILPPGYFRCLN